MVYPRENENSNVIGNINEVKALIVASKTIKSISKEKKLYPKKNELQVSFLGWKIKMIFTPKYLELSE